MTYTKIVHSEEELRWFYDNVLPPLKPTEQYFLSLSARNKYLTEQEREEIGLGRTEMFEKRIVRTREWGRFIRTVRKFECDVRGYTTKKGHPIPEKTITCYINIHPSDSVKALEKFMALAQGYYTEMAYLACSRGTPDNVLKRIAKIDNNLMTCFQQATGTRHWMDFDFDVDKNTDVIGVTEEKLRDRNVDKYIWVDTKSGYHLLVDKQQVKFNPAELAQEVFSTCGLNTGEIIYNKNAMIPLPGTYQGGHKVTILNKERIWM